MERNLQIAISLLLVIVAAGLIYTFTVQKEGGPQGSRVRLSAVPQVIGLPDPGLQTKTCVISAEFGPPGTRFIRISLTGAYFITNYGTESTEIPAKIAVIFNNEKAWEENLTLTYKTGDVVFRGKKIISFVTEIPTTDFDLPNKVFNNKVDYSYRLVYCGTGCTTPETQGTSFYENTTKDCDRIPFRGP